MSENKVNYVEKIKQFADLEKQQENLKEEIIVELTRIAHLLDYCPKSVQVYDFTVYDEEEALRLFYEGDEGVYVPYDLKNMVEYEWLLMSDEELIEFIKDYNNRKEHEEKLQRKEFLERQIKCGENQVKMYKNELIKIKEELEND